MLHARARPVCVYRYHHVEPAACNFIVTIIINIIGSTADRSSCSCSAVDVALMAKANDKTALK